MKKFMRTTLALLVAALFCATFANAEEGILARAKEAVTPQVGGAKIESIQILNSDTEDPYILRFGIEFNKKVKQADAFWSTEEPRSNELPRTGIKTYKMDDFGYVWLVTFDMRTMKNLPNGFATPIEFYIGCNNPLNGYPNFRRIQIHPRKDVPQSERSKYLEATPLEMVADAWKDELRQDEKDRTYNFRTLK